VEAQQKSNLADWFATPKGEYVLRWEQAQFDSAVEDVFGFNAVQVGLPQFDLLRQNRIPLRTRVGLDAASDLVADSGALPLASGSVDLVALPHVLEFSAHPHRILREAARVLKPGGLLYLSEPVFAGDLNEVIRLFHDEQEVRRAAYVAIQRALESGDWESGGETRFDTPVEFRDFADFERRVVNVTFADHRLDEPTRSQVRRRFEAHMGASGAHFMRPMRVNLLRKRQ